MRQQKAEISGKLGQLTDAAWELLLCAWEQCSGPEPIGHAGSGSGSSAARSTCRAGQLYVRCCNLANTGGPAASSAVAQQRAAYLCTIATKVVASDVVTTPLASLAVVLGWQVLPRSQLAAGVPVFWLAAMMRLGKLHPAHFACHSLLWEVVPHIYGALLEASTIAAGWPTHGSLLRSCAAAADACMAVLDPEHKLKVVGHACEQNKGASGGSNAWLHV